MIAYLGELAALGTSLCFSATSTFFTFAGRQVGSLVVNRTRLVLAVIFLTATHLLLGLPLPLHVAGNRWFWLSLSGVIGLVLGDAFLFQAFIWIGPRLSMLLMALVPIISTGLAWLFLSETLSLAQLLGILLTVSGIAWVILEQNSLVKNDRLETRNYLMGIAFGLGGALGQALGLVTAKEGLSGDFSALTGTLIRMIAATLTLWGFTFLQGQAKATLQHLFDRRQAIWFILGGAFAGPFLGVTFSLIAIQRTQVGIASTLMALPPVFLLPIGHFVFKERFGWQAVLGTLLAMAGVGLLFLV